MTESRDTPQVDAAGYAFTRTGQAVDEAAEALPGLGAGQVQPATEATLEAQRALIAKVRRDIEHAVYGPYVPPPPSWAMHALEIGIALALGFGIGWVTYPLVFP